jgi:hypothetical protein
MSWLTPSSARSWATTPRATHKLKFFENGATPNIVATVAKEVSPENFEKFQELFEAQHRGLDSAYETLFLGGGADVKVIGADMRQIDFKVTQGHGETGSPPPPASRRSSSASPRASTRRPTPTTRRPAAVR